MNRQAIAELHEEMGLLASITCLPGWETGRDETIPRGPIHDGAPLDRDVLGAGRAKPLGKGPWQSAMAVAMIVGVAVPHAPTPKPGADPDGFIWLTYDDEARSRRLTLEVHFTLIAPAHVRSTGKRFDWTTRRDGFDAKHTSWSITDVIASMRATFPATSSVAEKQPIWTGVR